MNYVLPDLNSRAVRDFILNHLASVNLLSEAEATPVAPDKTCWSNASFWYAVFSYDAKPLSWIELPSYQLCDWFPRSPGLYHTVMAEEQREVARIHIVNENGVLHYEPYGKGNMIEGGIGTVRFQPIQIEGEDHWLCTATSDGYCHSGIPLAVPHSLMRNIDLHQIGHFRIVGQLRFLPKLFDEHFAHYTHIKQLYLQVSELQRLNNQGFPITVTPMVFFSTGSEHEDRHNVTYVQCKAHDDIQSDSAAQWIEEYVARYGKTILTNFDQQRPTFADAPFSLQSVMSNRIKTSVIESVHIQNAKFVQAQIDTIFAKRANMNTNISVTLGDGTVIHGNVVVANSIKDSFNKTANADSPDELKETLKDLVVSVGKLTESLDKDDAAAVARDLDSLTSEATSAKPRERSWQVSMEGIAEAAEKVADVGKPVLEFLAKLTPLLMAVS